MRPLFHSLKEAYTFIFKWQNVYLHLLFVKFAFFFVYLTTFLFCPTKIVT